ncbi:MAG: hypothetical protein LBV49_04230 [Azonexus sp.]|jgi:hypothetical protein|nr:hypothetical protein [Azonexus sp.]
MSSTDRSINQRLQKAKSREKKIAIALDWAEEWRGEQAYEIAKLGAALQRGDSSTAEHSWRHLQTMADKRFSALPKVLSELGLSNDLD